MNETVLTRTCDVACNTDDGGPVETAPVCIFETPRNANENQRRRDALCGFGRDNWFMMNSHG
jgi:hypothetical protein